MYLLDLFEGRWKKGQCDLVCRVLLDDFIHSFVKCQLGENLILRIDCNVTG